MTPQDARKAAIRILDTWPDRGIALTEWERVLAPFPIEKVHRAIDHHATRDHRTPSIAAFLASVTGLPDPNRPPFDPTATAEPGDFPGRYLDDHQRTNGIERARALRQQMVAQAEERRARQMRARRRQDEPAAAATAPEPADNTVPPCSCINCRGGDTIPVYDDAGNVIGHTPIEPATHTDPDSHGIEPAGGAAA